MQTNPSIPSYQLEHLTNDDLLASTRRLVGASNVVLAGLLAHLAEVEARGIHRLRSCATLVKYCVFELRMSEDAALRRVHAARFARKFPVLFEQIARGQIHLTGLLMLGPHLTDENHLEVLARAKHRKKNEIAALVREIDPLPDVPARVEPLGPPAPKRGNGSWSQFATALAGPVRELREGERPADWVPGEIAEPAEAAEKVEPDRGSPRAPQRYGVQFTATQEYIDLLERARDLLSHAVPNRSLEEVHLRAMRLLVAELEKRKYAVTDKPRHSRPMTAATSSTPDADANEPKLRSRWRGRSVPAEVRRAIWERDQGQCTYVDERGVRCRETAFLELHHKEPHALGGPPTVENMCLRCKAHNALAAEEDFGRELMEQKKGTATAPTRSPQPAPARVAPDEAAPALVRADEASPTRAEAAPAGPS